MIILSQSKSAKWPGISRNYPTFGGKSFGRIASLPALGTRPAAEETAEQTGTHDSGAYTANDTLIGGLVGMSIGVLGGPIGVMLDAFLSKFKTTIARFDAAVVAEEVGDAGGDGAPGENRAASAEERRAQGKDRRPPQQGEGRV